MKTTLLKRGELMQIYNLIFIVVGLFMILAAIMNWDWFMESSRARMMSRLLTRNGARIFYAILGLALISFSLLSFIKSSGTV